MGGKLFKLGTKNREEYFKIYQKVLDKLLWYSNHHARINLIPSYRNKQIFGDMDIMVCAGDIDTNELITNRMDRTSPLFRLFGSTLIKKNGNVISFDYENFQIDLIFQKEKYYDSALVYYSYNDLGNLMGRVASKLGFRYGHFGLRYDLYSNDRDQLIKKIELNLTSEEIFNFLGFNFQEWKNGFDELKDIYEYVTNSKYFNKDIFLYENLNHQNRTRNKKRKVYQKFIDYIQDKPTRNIIRKGDALYLFNEMYPQQKLWDKIQIEQNNYKKQQEYKKKFNGNIIMGITNLQGKELGKFMKFFTDVFNKDYILKVSQSTLINNIIDMKQNWEIQK
jgi:hypothetical protein